MKIVPADLSKLSNVVNNEVVKKSMYNKLTAKVNNNDTKYDTDQSGLHDADENTWY